MATVWSQITFLDVGLLVEFDDGCHGNLEDAILAPIRIRFRRNVSSLPAESQLTVTALHLHLHTPAEMMQISQEKPKIGQAQISKQTTRLIDPIQS